MSSVWLPVSGHSTCPVTLPWLSYWICRGAVAPNGFATTRIACTSCTADGSVMSTFPHAW